ncbi:MAG: hypothetical protein JNM56_35270 [Planctomycetia bacterium]|nr:hypothetical protein [Planctomycetia bacterium]
MSEFDPFDADADPFRPPKISVVVGCLHCQETYDSYRIEYRIETIADGSQHGSGLIAGDDV